MRGLFEFHAFGLQREDGTVDAEADEIAARVRKACQEMPDPELPTMFDHQYTEPHPVVDAEREEFLAYHAGFAEEGDAR